MQTNFSEKQLQNKDNQSTEKIFKKCVHCGMCNATCPTHQLLGDELDGPRGIHVDIWQIIDGYFVAQTL